MSIQFKLLSILDDIKNLDYLTLVNFLKINFNHQIYVKKINDSLLLIHNNFNNNCEIDPELFNECKSIVIDISTEKPKIVSYTHDNINYYILERYKLKDEPYINHYEESYEGTLISVFNHNDEWILTTSRCGNIDKSYYYNKNKSFGAMFDECLTNFITDPNPRQAFLDTLDKNNCYYFVLVHYENKNLIDYSTRFGNEYKLLIHTLTRDKETLMDIIIEPIPGMIYPSIFSSLSEVENIMYTQNDFEGIIIKKRDEKYKLQMSKIYTNKFYIEKMKSPNYANRWYSYLEIFKNNDNEYKIENFQKRKGIIEDIIINEKNIDVTGMIYNLLKGTSENIYNLIMIFTKFDLINKKFEKKRIEEFEILNVKECAILKRQISILQHLITKGIIKNANNITKHLRTHVSVYHIIDLFHGIKYLIDNSKFIKYNKYYKLYLNYILEKIEE